MVNSISSPRKWYDSWSAEDLMFFIEFLKSSYRAKHSPLLTWVSFLARSDTACHTCSIIELVTVVWMFASPCHPNSYTEFLTPKDDDIGRRAFGKWLGHEDGDFMNRINAPVEEAPERFLASFYHMKTGQEGPAHEAQIGSSLTGNHAGPSSETSALGTVKGAFCCLGSSPCVVFCYGSLSRLRYWLG